MQLRQLAGLELKNTIRLQNSQMNPQVLQFVQESIIPVLADEDRRCRMIASQIITTLLHTVTLARWPSLVPTLLPMLDQGGHGAHGAIQVGLQLETQTWSNTTFWGHILAAVLCSCHLWLRGVLVTV